MTGSSSILASTSDVRELRFPDLAAPDRRLVPIQAGQDVPFEIRRVFTITAAREGLVGGQHAHRRCIQVLVCLSGSCEVLCRDGTPSNDRRFSLMGPSHGLYIPASIWAEQIYTVDPTVLMVLCDRAYEADDYLRDYQAFLAWRRDGGGDA